jgi:putative endonuclease
LSRRRLIFIKPRGWTVYILECADGTLATGFTSNFRKRIADINIFRKGYYFSKFKIYPNRLPVKVIFKETHLPFKEALSKAIYLKDMNRKLKKKLLNTGVWPIGGAYKEYLVTGRASLKYRGKNGLL